MKCHFVYSVPPNNLKLFTRLERRIRHMLVEKNIPVNIIQNRQPSQRDMQNWPIRSPFENTRNIYSALSQRVPTYLYHLTERVHCNFDSDDIFIGHPYFPYRSDGYGVTELAFKEPVRPQKMAIITPLHCNTVIKTSHINQSFLQHVDELVSQSDVLFAIMGEYWGKQWENSPYAHWLPKIVRLDMAVDVRYYPRVKTKFNKPGKRGYLYIGMNDPLKGLDFFSDLAEAMGEYPRGWIGNGSDISNVPRISKSRPLTPAFMAKIADEFDFFISPSRADANPTTILESMAWGFPVVCTPQSGYYETSYRYNIHHDNLKKSIETLKFLQYANEADLIEMANKAREVVEVKYNWDIFTSRILHHLGL